MICQLCNKHMHSSTFQVCESCRSDLKALILTRREMMKQQEKVLFQETISFNGDQNFDETIEHHGITFYKYMGLFDFIGDITSATVKVALTPIAIAKDAVNVATGEQPNTTKELLESAGEDLSDARDEIIP